MWSIAYSLEPQVVDATRQEYVLFLRAADALHRSARGPRSPLFGGGNLSPGEREDRANRWIIAAFGLIGLLMAYVPAFTDRKDFWTIDGDTIRWLGVVLFAAGGALRIWPVFVLGRRTQFCC
jgi:hypothetical protein